MSSSEAGHFALPPLVLKKEKKALSIVSLDNAVKKDFEIRKFKFSHVFKESDDQDIVFEKTAVPIVENVISGYNGCIMAYGQTGTGKTHTILGKRDGLLPRSLEYIFERNKPDEENFIVDISCLQIYMESLTDLFDYKKKAIQIREKNGSFFVTNSVWVRINNYQEALQVLDEAENRRKSCSTNMNQYSSRSHALFIIKVTNIRNMTSSNLYLVDLAGSERIKKSFAQGERLEEAISINTSLMALSKCIYGISENKWSHIPYRESKLTKILQDTLAGNGRSVIIITVSPDTGDVEETVSSLKFGQRASKIYCSPKLCKIDNDELGHNVMALDDQKRFLEEENLALKEQCKQLMKIVETTASKQKKSGLNDDLADEDEQENYLSKSPVKYDSPLKMNWSCPLSEFNEENFKALTDENKKLKTQIEKAELDAFDNMRLAYEEIEEKLYEEISELKAIQKKQKKQLASQVKTIDDLNRQLEEARVGFNLENSVNSQVDVEYLSFNQKKLPSGNHLKWIESLPEHQASLLSQIHQAFTKPEAGKQPKIETIINRINMSTTNLTSNSCHPGSKNKENWNENSPIKKENTKATNQTKFDQHLSPSRTLNELKNFQNVKNMTPCLMVNGLLSPSKVADEQQYRSATPEHKEAAKTKIIKALETLISEVEGKCSTIVASCSSEDEALGQANQKMQTTVSGFTSCPTFIALLDEFAENKVSIMKLALGIIVEGLVKRLVLQMFSDRQARLVGRQNTALKAIIFEEKVQDQCLGVIREKNLTRKAAICIQRAYKKYRWRKHCFQRDATSGPFDWGRMKAAMGKEHLQILLTDIEHSMSALFKALS
jgi:hypothetical protein